VGAQRTGYAPSVSHTVWGTKRSVNRRQLIAQLGAANVDPRFYSVLQGPLDECYCLKDSPGGFVTFYSERGERVSEREFAAEAEACEYFLQWVLHDSSVRR
jgi:hypothetical protein